jgi:hypothetical protein
VSARHVLLSNRDFACIGTSLGIWRVGPMIKTLKTITAAVALMVFADTANAQTLNNNDIIGAVKAYNYDRPRFDRDYKGKMFSDLMVFDDANENAFIPDDYFVIFKRKGTTHVTVSVTCRTHDESVVKEVLNWNKVNRHW